MNPLREQVAALVHDAHDDEARKLADRYLAACEGCEHVPACRPPAAWFLLSHFPCGRMYGHLRLRILDPLA